MPRPKNRVPSPPKGHNGQARVWWNGEHVYLGPFGSAEAARNYAALVKRATDHPGEPSPLRRPGSRSGRPSDPLVAEVLAWYAVAVGPGLDAKGASVVAVMVDSVTTGYGDRPLSQFGPKAVTEWLRGMAAGTPDPERPERWARKPLGKGTIRRQLRLLRDALRWAIADERVTTDQFPWAAIQVVKAADAPGRPPRKVLAADDDEVDATLPHLMPPVRALVEIQRLTGMRPNDELFLIRPADVHRSGRVTLSTGVAVDLDKINAGQPAKVWVYVPAWHKQQYAGAGRDVPLGPKAQAVLAPFLLRGSDEHCFSPRESLAYQLETRRRSDRKLGDWRLHLDTPAVLRLNKRYTADSYRQAIAYACRKAKVADWFPYRLRHSTATETAAEAGLEVARAVLGQADLDTTRQYAERDFKAAAERMRQAG